MFTTSKFNTNRFWQISQRFDCAQMQEHDRIEQPPQVGGLEAA